MDTEFSLTLVFILLPLLLGVLARFSGISHIGAQWLALACLGGEIGALVYLAMTFEPDPIRFQLAAAILLTGLCAVLGQGKFNKSSQVLGTILIVLGLSLGALMAPNPIQRVFLISLFGYAAFSVLKSKQRAIPKSISLIHIGSAMLFMVGSSMLGDTLNWWIGLFLALTLIPVVPFHFPFVLIIGSAEGMLSCVWVVVLISLGLAEIDKLLHSMLFHDFFVIQWFALVSAVYASLKCLVETQYRTFIAYAAVAQLALLWSIQQVFLEFSTWGIPFGLAVAFVMSGLGGVYAFIQQRYGSHELGKFPGLAISMPRLGILMILLITLAMVIPILPISAGIMGLPTMEHSDVPLLTILLTFSAVWLLGGWYFSNLLHQLAFGKADPTIPYADLCTTETGTLVLLILGASVSGFFL